MDGICHWMVFVCWPAGCEGRILPILRDYTRTNFHLAEAYRRDFGLDADHKGSRSPQDMFVTAGSAGNSLPLHLELFWEPSCMVSRSCGVWSCCVVAREVRRRSRLKLRVAILRTSVRSVTRSESVRQSVESSRAATSPRRYRTDRA